MASVPIRLPATWLPMVVPPVSSTPSPKLPEMTLPRPVPGVVCTPMASAI